MNIKTLLLTVILSSSALVSAHPTYITTSKQYNSLFNGSKPMITLYTSPSCGPCRQMKPHFYKASNSHCDVEFFIVDISQPQMQKVARDLNIQGIPTVIFSHQGKEINRTRGLLNKRDLDQEIAQFKSKVSNATVKKATKTENSSKPAPKQIKKTTTQK